MKFVQAIAEQEARTENDMKARKSAANACVDLFYKIGASRGKNILPEFIAAMVENEEVACRIAQWGRDVRGGAGERQLFIDILKYLVDTKPELALRLLPKVPEIGRWKDVLTYLQSGIEDYAIGFIKAALDDNNGLAAKWMPRKGEVATYLTQKFGFTPKQYRKFLVERTNVVETPMCAKQWETINFNHVPSLAHARYKKAFLRNSEAYKQYVANLVKGEAKINAAAVYPYDVLKNVYGSTKVEQDVMLAQWEALPDYMGEDDILPIVDVSGSMNCSVGANKNLVVMFVAMALGLYIADKNKGDFKDCFMTFSANPELLRLKGTVIQKWQQMRGSGWGYNTNLHAVFDLLLKTALDNKVTPESMPKMLLILSDMQFDGRRDKWDDSAIQMIERKYAESGYEVPKIVFWNLRDAGNVPVRFDKTGVAMVSGFSPAILKPILKAEDFTPEAIMLDAVMIDRYNF